MGSILSSIKQSVVSAWRDFKEEPIDIIGKTIPILRIIIAITTGLVSWIAFIMKGGYVTQINILKSEGIEAAFTFVERKGLNGTIMQVGIWSLFAAEILLMLIALFMEAAVWKKIMMAVTLSLSAIVGLVSYSAYKIFNFWDFAFAKVKLTEEQIETIVKVTQDAKGNFSMKTYIAIVGVLAFVFVGLLLLEENRWMLKNSVIAIAINFLAVPLTLNMVANIIALVIVGLILLVIWVVFHIFAYTLSEEKFMVTVRDGVVDSVNKISEK